MKNYRKPLADTALDYFDVEQAINDIRPSAYDNKVVFKLICL
ncbi:hypothetical protein [Moraxella sp. ZY210820]|nr:hypothetical protein [Moraxella sp. ZY210820]